MGVGSPELDWGGTVICSRDKDLLMVPGYHFCWSVGGKKAKKHETVDEPFFVAEIQGMRWFFKQLLMGDKSVDNIPGLHNIGEKSALVKKIDDMDSVEDMYAHVRKQYENYFGSYWKMFMHENARLLWMLQTPDDDIRDLLEMYEEGRQEVIAAESAVIY